mmetsp:Transcript_111937/g.216913  ORF Transcript_111937/g.216913 Transcript_111937/m.216913 type:complete len:151 (+) Transcript_111937:58-510(+)
METSASLMLVEPPIDGPWPPPLLEAGFCSWMFRWLSMGLYVPDLLREAERLSADAELYAGRAAAYAPGPGVRRFAETAHRHLEHAGVALRSASDDVASNGIGLRREEAMVPLPVALLAGLSPMQGQSGRLERYCERSSVKAGCNVLARFL